MLKLKDCALTISCLNYYLGCGSWKKSEIFSQTAKRPSNVCTKFCINLTSAIWMKNHNVKKQNVKNKKLCLNDSLFSLLCRL